MGAVSVPEPLRSRSFVCDQDPSLLCDLVNWPPSRSVTTLSGVSAQGEGMAEVMALSIAVPRLAGGGFGDHIDAAPLAARSDLRLCPSIEGGKKHLVVE